MSATLPTGTLLVDGAPTAPVELALTRRSRSKGLLGRDGVEGAVWFEPCRQVHTFRMRFPIDVAYVDRRGRVLLVRTLPPGRVGPLSPRARAILEAAEGALETWGVRPGTDLAVDRAEVAR
jgi:uncharacterized protein